MAARRRSRSRDMNNDSTSRMSTEDSQCLENALPDVSTCDGRLKFALCSSCKRQIKLRNDGLIRIHGPVSNRCPGS